MKPISFRDSFDYDIDRLADCVKFCKFLKMQMNVNAIGGGRSNVGGLRKKNLTVVILN